MRSARLNPLPQRPPCMCLRVLPATALQSFVPVLLLAAEVAYFMPAVPESNTCAQTAKRRAASHELKKALTDSGVATDAPDALTLSTTAVQLYGAAQEVIKLTNSTADAVRFHVVVRLLSGRLPLGPAARQTRVFAHWILCKPVLLLPPPPLVPFAGPCRLGLWAMNSQDLLACFVSSVLDVDCRRLCILVLRGDDRVKAANTARCSHFECGPGRE